MKRWLSGFYKIVKEVLRHILRRPVVGVNVFATTNDGRVLLIRRGDTGGWALPGGTIEWGENLRNTAVRELLEEAGVTEVELGGLKGVYSAPERDPRFHAVTVVVEARVEPPSLERMNPAEILEVRLFPRDELPAELSHGNDDMLSNAIAAKEPYWE